MMATSKILVFAFLCLNVICMIPVSQAYHSNYPMRYPMRYPMSGNSMPMSMSRPMMQPMGCAYPRINYKPDRYPLDVYGQDRNQPNQF